MARFHFDPRSLSIDHISETDRFGDMLGADLIGTGKIRNRPCDFNDAVIASGRKVQLSEDDTQHVRPLLVELASLLQLAMPHLRIVLHMPA